MSRKHYEQLAKTLNVERRAMVADARRALAANESTVIYDAELRGFDSAVLLMCGTLKTENANFDRDRFLAAVNATREVNA